jgi:hypothetical protein
MERAKNPFGFLQIPSRRVRGQIFTVTAALSGQAATYSAGTVAPSTAVALSGSAATYAAGTVTPSSSSTVALSGEVGTYQAGSLTASTASGIDPFAADEYRKSLRNLAKIAEERRRATVEEAKEIRKEILAALGEAKPIQGSEVKAAVKAVSTALPGTTAARVTANQLTRVTDWTAIYQALESLRAAIEYERMLDQDDEEVLLLI